MRIDYNQLRLPIPSNRTQMAVTSKANDSPCSLRVDLAVRKTSLVAPWIAPVCLVRVVPSIACWFLASRKQLVGRLAAHSLDGPFSLSFPFDIHYVFCFGTWPGFLPYLALERPSSTILDSLELNYKMASEIRHHGSFLESRPYSWPLKFGYFSASWIGPFWICLLPFFFFFLVNSR